MPTGPAPLVAQKKCGPPSGIGKQEVTQLLEPNFPDHHHHHHHASKQDAKWTKHTHTQAQQQQHQQQPQTRNIYSWISAPRAIYNNKRLMRMSNDHKGRVFGFGESLPTVIQPEQQHQQELVELESPAFAIVSSDHHSYRASSLGKPNAIVRPLRHGRDQREVIEGEHLVNLHPDYKLLHEIEAQLSRNNSRQKENDAHNGNGKDGPVKKEQNVRGTKNYAPGAIEIEKTTDGRGQQQQQQPQHHHRGQHEFSRELDAKLRKLQNDSSKRSSKNGSTQEVNTARKRPLFITTVPKGVFLQPTKELPAALLPATSNHRRLYAFESRPRILTAPSLSSNHPQHNNNNNNDINHPNHNHPGEYVCKHGSHHYGKPPRISYPTEPDTVRKVTVTELQSIVASGGQHQGRPSHRTSRPTGSWTTSKIVTANRTVWVIRDDLPRDQQQHQQQQQNGAYQNVMHDRRVVRGSNYTSTSNLQVGHVNNYPNMPRWNPYFGYAGLLSGKGDGDGTQKEAEARRRQMLRKKYVSRNQRGIIGTPPPVRGRRHETVQTEKYLEELFLHPPELDAGCQTDLFLHRPASPPYIPAKTGCDASTEILDGELFDFDTEVQPIIEVLVSRTLEQALVEVLHEEEIAEMKQQQQTILALREAELAELRRLEQEERKRQAERDRRFLQDKIALDLDREMQERITAAKLLQGRLDEIVPEVLAAVDKIETEKDRAEFERQITPWLAKEVAHEIGQWIDANALLEDIIREILLHKKKLLEGDAASDTADEPQYDEVELEEVEDEKEVDAAAVTEQETVQAEDETVPEDAPAEQEA
uniref:Radial spoke head protein 3 n=1 Tax=Anopheles christyi TaxID=43041 RepID=A0A182JSY8_9DIPT